MRPIYLDNHATTAVDPRVVQRMLPWLTERFGNPSSKAHDFGREAARGVERARATVAAVIGARRGEVVFTSGATESINLAIRGAVLGDPDGRDHVVLPATEHKATLESARAVERAGGAMTIVPTGEDGLVRLADLEAAITERTVLVCAMAVNNEIGVLQPLAEIGALCRKRGVGFFCDGAQAPGRTPIDVHAMAIDALSLTGHKCYGPKGAGALYIDRDRLPLRALTAGGGQEFGLRSGTLATHQIVGLAAALRLTAEDFAAEDQRLRGLRDRLLARLSDGIEGLSVNGSLEHRAAGNLSVAIPCADANTLLVSLPELALSSGSACSSGSTRPSGVLTAIGLPAELAHCSLRFGIGRFNTEAEIDRAAELVVHRVEELRASSSLWKLRKAGVSTAC